MVPMSLSGTVTEEITNWGNYDAGERVAPECSIRLVLPAWGDSTGYVIGP